MSKAYKRISNLERAQKALKDGAIMVPDLEEIFVGDGDYLAIAEEFLGHFVNLGGLEPHHAVLEIGCGIGRMAAGLATYLNPTSGSYVGFDPVKMGIIWCENAFVEYPHFHFEEANIHNELYRPYGKTRPAEYRFPVLDASIDMVIATSVFTHLHYDDVKAYLGEVARVLKPTGKMFATFFLYEGDKAHASSVPHLKFSVADDRFPFQYHVAGYPPLAAVSLQREALRDLITKSLRRQPKFYPGRWRGGEGPTFQDLVIV